MKGTSNNALIWEFKSAFCKAFCEREKCKEECKGCPIQKMDDKEFKNTPIRDFLQGGDI